MAFTLAYTVTERNDNKTLTITDASGEVATGTLTGWGAPNPLYTAIVASGGLHTLELNVTITTSDGTATTYDTIDLYTVAGGVAFVTIADLVFDLDCSDFVSGGTALGTSADEFPDGIYDIEYVYDEGLVGETTTTSKVLIDGVVLVGVYDLLRQIPTIYNCTECKSKTVLDAIYCYGCLNVMRSDAYASKQEELLALLYTIERLIVDGSRYTW